MSSDRSRKPAFSREGELANVLILMMWGGIRLG
ncbi:glutathionylspermidine synthase family protein [Bosea sp. BIWAKO-01]|nr:glutathionylspermidine synthase family protein [Bosea sp. BIWAKO-01]